MDVIYVSTEEPTPWEYEVVEMALNLKVSQYVQYVVPLVSNTYCNLYGVFLVQVCVLLKALSQFIVYTSCASLNNDYVIYLLVAFMYE